MRYFVVLIAIFLIGPTALAAPSGTDLLREINTIRQARKFAPLINSYTLRKAAAGRADDMTRFNYFSHTSLTGRTYRAWLTSAPVKFRATGENIARGQRSSQLVVTDWQASGSHRTNLLNPAFTHAGTAVRKVVVHGTVTYLYVAIFGQSSQR